MLRVTSIWGRWKGSLGEATDREMLVQDYLTAPMPYLIGIPAPHLLQGLEHMDLEEVVFVDLDAGTCR